jgi:hypothetical protein
MNQQSIDQRSMSAALRMVIKLLLALNMARHPQVAVAQTPNASGQSQCLAMQAQPDQALP